jgi:hypothetical protein
MKYKETNYYVYTHSTEKHGIFYVGKGTEKRIKIVERAHNLHHTRIVNKYGKENITVKSMLCRSEQHDLDLEVKMITALRNGGVKLTNMTDGGEGFSGMVHSDKSKAKMSAVQKGRIVSDKTKLKMSESAKNRSDETRAKMSVSQIGKTHSEETRVRMSEAQKGRVFSDEHKANLVLAWDKLKLAKLSIYLKENNDA